jgi:hypothetical protein
VAPGGRALPSARLSAVLQPHLACCLTSRAALGWVCPSCPECRRDGGRPPRDHLRVPLTEREDDGRWPWRSVWRGWKTQSRKGRVRAGPASCWRGCAKNCTGAWPASSLGVFCESYPASRWTVMPSGSGLISPSLSRVGASSGESCRLAGASTGPAGCRSPPPAGTVSCPACGGQRGWGRRSPRRRGPW